MLIFAFYTVFFASVFNSKKCHLFSDAKVLEDVLKYGVGGYLAYDVGEVVDALAEVLGDEVTGEACLKAVLHAVDGVEGTDEGFVVAQVGDDDITLRYFGEGGGIEQECFQLFKASAALGGDEELGGVDVGKCLEERFALLGSDLVGFVEEEEETLVRNHVTEF